MGGRGWFCRLPAPPLLPRHCEFPRPEGFRGEAGRWEGEWLNSWSAILSFFQLFSAILSVENVVAGSVRLVITFVFGNKMVIGTYKMKTGNLEITEKETRASEELDNPWQVVLFNDEVHSFDEVIL